MAAFVRGTCLGQMNFVCPVLAFTDAVLDRDEKLWFSPFTLRTLTVLWRDQPEEFML